MSGTHRANYLVRLTVGAPLAKTASTLASSLLLLPKSSRPGSRRQKRPDFRQHTLKRFPLPHGQGSFRPSFSSSSLSPWTTRTPRLTCVFEGNPLRRLLMGSKILFVVVSAICHVAPPFEMNSIGGNLSIIRASSPGIEPGPRPSQGRVQDPPHPEDVSFLSDEPVISGSHNSFIILRYQNTPPRNRTPSCRFEVCRAVHHTRRAWSRRLDLHQHRPVYKTGASLFGHVGIFMASHTSISRSARIRTL